MIRKAVFAKHTAALSALILQAAPIWFLCGDVVADSSRLPATAEALLDFPRLPAVSIDPAGRYLLLVHEHGLLPLESLQHPSVSVAATRIDLRTGGSFAPIPYFGLTLIDRETGDRNRIELPDEATIGYPQWSPDGTGFLFTLSSRDEIELWVGDVDSRVAEKLIEGLPNASRGAPCRWMPDSKDVLCRMIVEDRGSLPEGLTNGTSVSPTNELRPDLLDRQLVDYFLRSQLELINVQTAVRTKIGEPEVWTSAEPSPDGRLILVTRNVPSPSMMGTAVRWRSVTEIRDRSGGLLRTFPSAAANESGALRAAHWRATAPSTVVWVERVNDVERVLQQHAPFSALPLEIFRTPHRFGGVKWVEGSSLAVVNVFDASNRKTTTVLVDAAHSGESPRPVWSWSVDVDSPARHGLLSDRSAEGHSVARVVNNRLYATGRDGRQSTLELVELDSLTAERVWESDEESFDTVVGVMGSQGDVLLLRRESVKTPPNYLLHDLRSGAIEPLTQREHPAPELADVQRIPLDYRRADGLELSSTLLVPPDYAEGETLPLLVWAYPRQVGATSFSTATDESARFPRSEHAFKLMFAASGYAVLDDVSMPIAGDAETANDTFLEQIIANADAAVSAAVDTGIVDPERVGVAGHSYGAFMAANLLAHTRLFAAGVAMSGAYNRTLTPFGFQTERRTLWEARETYLRMSPLLYSDQIDAPLLLIHGMLDDNPGTRPIHSTQLYDAIRHNGGESSLVLLPYEGHSYRSREAVLQVAAGALEWFDTHLSGRSQPVSSLRNNPAEAFQPQ
ncbi:MAG: prolyl oligopeptidase family serine peptidase [Gammaproteobacteria bacterium]